MSLAIHMILCSSAFQSVFSQTCVTGNYSDVVNISGANNITISNLRISPTSSTPCINLANCHNVTITNCVLGPSADVGISLSLCSNVTITGNSFYSNSGGVYVSQCTGGIKVNSNQFANPQGGNGRGQYVQFVSSSGSGNEVNNNVGESVIGVSNPVDLINLYNSTGTAGSPITVSGNRFRGGGPSISGGGILVGDEGGSDVLVQNNILVDPGQYGIAIPSGSNMKLLNNQIYGRQQSFTNVGMYVYKLYSSLPCGNDTVQGNQVNYTRADGVNNPYYIPTTPPNVACSPTVVSGNNWNASIGASILPSRLLCPVLMANYKFNSNWGDSSGSQLTATSLNMAYAGQGRDLMCGNFNGTTAYLTAPRSPWLVPKTERITVSCWVRTFKNTGIQGVAQSQDADGYNNGWRMLLNGSGFNLRMTTANGVADIMCGSVTQGSWSLLTMTYDGQQLRGYINGVLQNSITLTGNIVYTTSTTSPMKIGYCNSTDYYFYGYMDEFKFYDGNLQDSEILADYNINLPLVTSPAPENRAIYYFDQNWSDASGYHLDASSQGAGFICDGESYSANLTGISYLSIPQSPLLNPLSSTFTVGLWAKPSALTGIQALAQAENSDGFNSGWRMLLNANTFNARLTTNQGPIDLYCTCAQAGVWQYFVMTYDGYNFKIYYNGSPVSSSPMGGYIIYGATSLAQIGLANGLGYFKGHLDNFEFWDGRLTAAQVLQRYNYFLPFFQGGSCTLNSPKNALTGNSAIFNSTFKVFPNPASSELTISNTVQNENLTLRRPVQIELYSAAGQLLRTATMAGSNIIITTGNLSNGFYYLKILASGMIETQKIIISH